MMRASIARLRAGERGNSSLELALALPLVIALFMGAFDFGYSFFVYNELESQVRAGVRYASLRAYNASNAAAYMNAVRNVVVYGNSAGGSSPLISRLSSGNVVVEFTPANVDHTQPTAVTVSIANLRVGTFSPMTLSNKPRTQFPYLGEYTPKP